MSDIRQDDLLRSNPSAAASDNNSSFALWMSAHDLQAHRNDIPVAWWLPDDGIKRPSTGLAATILLNSDEAQEPLQLGASADATQKASLSKSRLDDVLDVPSLVAVGATPSAYLPGMVLAGSLAAAAIMLSKNGNPKAALDTAKELAKDAGLTKILDGVTGASASKAAGEQFVAGIVKQATGEATDSVAALAGSVKRATELIVDGAARETHAEPALSLLANANPELNIEQRLAKQDLLRSGDIKLTDLLDPQTYDHVFNGRLHTPLGDRWVVVHMPTKNNTMDQFMTRMRKEDAAQDMSPYLFNTVEPSVRRIQPYDATMYRSMVREFIGDDMRDLVKAADPPANPGKLDGTPWDFASEAPSTKAIGLRLYDWMASDPTTRKSMEEALIERTILGDRDVHELNFRGFAKNGSLTRVASIDLERSLNLMHTPTWTTPIWSSDLVSKYLRDQPLLNSTLGGIDKFLAHANNFQWREQILEKGNVNRAELDAITARAEYFAKTKQYPPLIQNFDN